MLFPTTLVGSYPQPEWLIDRKKLAGRFPPRVRAKELWRIPEAHLAEAQEDATVRERYEEANRRAARYCRALDERYLRRRRSRPDAWLAELRRFFRCGHQEKIRQLAV